MQHSARCSCAYQHYKECCLSWPQGSIFYLGGCAFVVVGWSVIGLLLEAYGFWLLFCEFIPTALQFFRRVPVMGKVLDLPLIKTVSRVCAAKACNVCSQLECWGMYGNCGGGVLGVCLLGAVLLDGCLLDGCLLKSSQVPAGTCQSWELCSEATTVVQVALQCAAC